MTLDASNSTATSARSAHIPRTVWVAFGVLALATAAMAGAMVMKASPAGEPAAAFQAEATHVEIGNPGAGTGNRRSHPDPRAAAAEERSVRHEITRAAQCSSCGVVESVAAVTAKGDGTGMGAVAGGVLGGVAGHQVGGGNGKTAMTVLGAIGGGLAGNEIERRVRSETSFDVHIRMNDGTHRVVRQAQSAEVGTQVQVDGDHLQTSAPAGGGA